MQLWLSMNTNAGARDEAWWTELAKTFGFPMGTVIFSLDGLILIHFIDKM